MALTVETIRGHLSSSGLSTTGNKKTIARRLYDHLQSQEPGSSSPSPSDSADGADSSPSSNGSSSSQSGGLSPGSRAPTRTHRDAKAQSSSTDEEDIRPSPRRRRRSGKASPSQHRKHRRSSGRRHRRERSRSAFRERSQSTSHRERSHHSSWHSTRRQSKYHRQQSSRHHRSRSTRLRRKRHYSSSDDTSTYRRSTKYLRSSSSESPHRGRRSRSRSRGRKRHRSFSDASDTSSSSESDACAYDTLPNLPFRTPPSRRTRDRIIRGKYVSFPRLLEKSRATLPQGSKLPSGQRSRQVHDLASWLEAWNIYLPTRMAHDSSMALELVKYQSIICSMFATFDATSVISYDRLFRHHAAKDPSVRWDSLKEDLFIFQASNQKTPLPFRKPVFNRLGPQPEQKPGQETHTPSGVEICRRFNNSRCSLNENCRYAHTCWVKGCGGTHPAKGCPLKHPPQ